MTYLCKLLTAFLTLSLILGCINNSFSQNPNPKVKIGIKAGYSLSNIKGTEVKLYRSGGGELKIGQGPLFGVTFMSHFKNPRWAFETELNYITKGGKITGSAFYETPDKTAGYLQLPLMIAYDLAASASKGVSVFFEAGGVLNYAVKPIKYNPSYYTNPNSIKTPKFMVSPAAGLKVQFFTSKVLPFIAIRHEFDNQKYFSRKASSTDYYIQHSGTTSFFAGLMFGI